MTQTCQTSNLQFVLISINFNYLGVALRDSPVGLAAYMLEKYPLWTNPSWVNLMDGGLTKKFKLEDLLDNVMIYWYTGCITTSMRIYAEAFTYRYLDMRMAS